MATDAFEYDGAGRLAGNARYVGQSLTSSYSEGGISYDRNGNMKTISRYGESGVTPVQNFSYVLAGNRVNRISGTSDTYRYDANGNMTHDPYRFSGKETLSGFGIDYMDFGARLYDPVIGRWLSQDPLAFSTPSVSPYSYCAGDPVNFVDPDGMFILETGTIEEGDDLQEITRLINERYNLNLSVNDIAKANNIDLFKPLEVGSSIVLPGTDICLIFDLTTLSVWDNTYGISLPECC